MPTHFSKLEGSPSNMQRERRRRRRTRADTATVHDESVGSSATVCEETNLFPRNLYQRDRLRNIPEFIHVQNSKRLPQIRNRSPQHDTYCQTRVSAISSFPNRDTSSSRPRESIRREQRDDDRRYATPPHGRGRPPPFSSRREHINANRITVRRLPENANRSTPAHHDHFIYDLTSISAPSEPSTLTNNSSSFKSYKEVHTLVNAHGVLGSIGSGSIHKHRHKNLNRRYISSSQRNRVRSTLASARELEQSSTESFGDPYSASLRRKDLIVIDDDSYDSQNDATLMGERFADTNSEFNDLPKKMTDSRHINDSSNISLGNFRQQQNTSGTKWLCDVCKVARFDSYVEAYRHEIECRKCQNENLRQTGTNVTKEPKALKYHQGDAEERRESSKAMARTSNDYFSSNYGEHIGSHLQEMSLSSSTESSPSNHRRINKTPMSPRIEFVSGSGNNKSEPSKKVTKWVSSMCNKVSSDNFRDAFTQEKICKIRMEATADLRAAGIDRPMGASAHLPTLHRAQTRSGGIGKIRKATTVDFWEEAEKAKGENTSPSSLNRRQWAMNNENRPDTLANTPEEGRQDVSNRENAKAQIRHETMDMIERERQVYSSVESPLEENHDERNPSEDRDEQCHANLRNNPDHTISQDFLHSGDQTKNHKGDAYDRYVLLANQQEEEEERERYIALAKQTREEELMSYRQGDNVGERYVCLA